MNIFAQFFYSFENKIQEVDVFEGSLSHWTAMKESAGDSELDLAVSAVYSDNYRVNALVPKTPVKAGFFNYVKVLPPLAWFLFVLAGTISAILESFFFKHFSRHKLTTFLKALYIVFKITVGESASK